MAGVGLLAQLSRVHAQPASPATINHVLDLDGNNSWVELPASAFSNYSAVTVEGWVKWKDFRGYERFFDFVVGGRVYHVSNFGTAPTLSVQRDRADGFDVIRASNILQAGTWCHVAAVCATNKLKLFLGGMLLEKAPV